MKDRQGKWRVKCGIKGCDCTEYLVEDSKKIRCDYCDHSPADHCWLGSCKDSECKENEEAEEGSACTKYDEDEEDEGSGLCSYCGHKKEKHAIEKSNVSKVKTGTSSQPGLTSIQAKQMKKGLPKCKLPECSKPCYIEPNGHIHDFCCRTHAAQASAFTPAQPPLHMPFPPKRPPEHQPQNPQPNTPGCPETAHSQPTSSMPKEICKRPGCKRPCFVDNGRVHDYCGRTCANKT